MKTVETKPRSERSLALISSYWTPSLKIGLVMTWLRPICFAFFLTSLEQLDVSRQIKGWERVTVPPTGPDSSIRSSTRLRMALVASKPFLKGILRSIMIIL